MKRVKLIISGRVHGVFFRANTKRKADSLKLKGFVKNIPNGKVEAVFEGPEEKIKQIIEFCKKPGFTTVTNVQVKQEKYKGEFNEFEIRY
jgi:acylphosphatase